MLDELDRIRTRRPNAIDPEHYRHDDKPEAIDLMCARLSAREVRGFCLGNAIKYLYRNKSVIDRIKARWYEQFFYYLDGLAPDPRVQLVPEAELANYRAQYPDWSDTIGGLL